jgi:hypothetical protein
MVCSNSLGKQYFWRVRKFFLIHGIDLVREAMHGRDYCLTETHLASHKYEHVFKPNPDDPDQAKSECPGLLIGVCENAAAPRNKKQEH